MNHASGHTLSIMLALAGEFWARGWRAILLAPLGALVLPSLIFGLMSWEHGTSFRDTEIGDLLQFSFYWMTIFSLGMSVMIALGNPVQRYTLPASSLGLVAGPMVCAMLTIFVQYAIVAMILNAGFDAGWQILGPGLLAAVLIAWYQAVLWSTSNSVGLQALVCLASTLPLLFVIRRGTPPHGAGMAELLHVSGWHVLFFGLATLVCLGVGTLGFANLRHGSGIDVRRILDGLSQIVPVRKRPHTVPFSSASSAQLWLEWTERGYILPVGTALIGIAVALVAWSIPVNNAADFLGGIAGLFLVPLLVIGLWWGNRSRLGEFGNFNGSRPLSDKQVANAILKSATLSLILFAIIWAACVSLVVLILGEQLETSKFYRNILRQDVIALLARVALGTLAAWGVVGFMTSLSLAGSRVTGVGTVLLFAVLLTGALFPLCLRHEFRPKFTQGYFLVCLVLSLFAVAATFIASWRRHLISLPVLLLAASMVLTAVAVAHFTELTREWRYLPLVLCGCGLIPMPLAAAPLAVYVNRHR